jgi:hypothetical protein
MLSLKHKMSKVVNKPDQFRLLDRKELNQKRPNAHSRREMGAGLGHFHIKSVIPLERDMGFNVSGSPLCLPHFRKWELTRS